MALFSTFFATLFAGTFWSTVVGSAILKFGVGLVINSLAAKLSGKKDNGSGFSVKGQMERGADLPQSFLLGRAATGGTLTYANVWGQSGKTPNAYLTMVISLSDLPAQSLDVLWVNGTKVTVGETAHAEYGYPVEEFNKDGYDFLWVKFYDGTQTVADPFLTDSVSSEERPWPATAIGNGTAYAVVTSRVNQQLFNGFPRFLFELTGAALYDPSKDGSIGGVGLQRYDDPTTWGGDGDHLPAVQIYNLMRGMRYDGVWLYGMQLVSEAQLPSDHWIAQINTCRATIAANSGNEAKYRSGGEIPVGAPLVDGIGALLDACQGRIGESGGVYKLFVGAPGSPVAAISDGDILSTEEQSFTPFFGLADTINGVSAKYPDPEQVWQMETAPPINSSDFEAQDGDRRLMVDMQFDLVPYPEQVQRLMQAGLREARRARRHSFVLPPNFWSLEPGDVFTWSSERNGYTDKRFRVDGVVDQANTDVVIDATEIDPTDYDFDTNVDFTPVVRGSVVTPEVPIQIISGWAAQPHTIQDGTSADRWPAIKVFWNAAVDDVIAVRIQVKDKITGATVFFGRFDDVEDGSGLVTQGLVANNAYQVRGRYVSGTIRETDWGGWVDVTTPDVGISVDGLGDDVWTKIGGDAADTAGNLITVFNNEVLAPFQLSVFDLTEPTSLAAKLNVLDDDMDARVDDIARINTDLGFHAPELRDASRSLEEVFGLITDVRLRMRTTDKRMADAGVYVDQATGTVRISGVQNLEGRFTEAMLAVDGINASINGLVTYSELTDFAFDGEIPELTDIQGRLTTVEFEASGLDARFAAASTTVTVGEQGVSLAQALLDIDSLEEEIILKVSSDDFGNLEDRQTASEIILNTIDGANLSLSVVDSRTAKKDIEDIYAKLTGAALDRRKTAKKLEGDIAFSHFDLKALVTEDRVALASAKLDLGGRIDGSIVLISDEKRIRADETSSLAESIVSLLATTGDQTAAIDEINLVEADSKSASARALHQLQLSVTGEGGLAEALTTVEGKVTDAEDGIEASISERGILRASVVDGEDAAAVADLRALINLRKAKKYTDKGLGEARRDLTVKVTEGLSVEAQKRVELTGVLDDSVARIDQNIRIRVTEHTALAESHDVLRADQDNTSGALTSFKQVVADDDVVFAQSITDLSGRVGINEGHVTDILALEVGAEHVFAQWYNSIDGAVFDPVTGLSSAHGRINTIDTVLINTSSANASRFEAIEGVVDDPTTGLNNAHARITSSDQVRVTNETANATRVALLEASMGGDLVNSVPDNQISNSDAWEIRTGWSLINPSGNSNLNSAGRFKYTYSGGTGDSVALDSSKFVVVAGETYSCGFQATRTDTGQFKALGKIRWFGDDGLWISTTTISTDEITTSGVFESSLEVVVPASVKWGQLRFTCDQDFTDVSFSVAGLRVERISGVVIKARGDILALNDISVTSESVLARDFFSLSGEVNHSSTGLSAAHDDIEVLDGELNDPITGLPVTRSGLLSAQGSIDQILGLSVSETEVFGQSMARFQAQIGGDGPNAVPDARISTPTLWTFGTGWTLDTNTTIPGLISDGHLKFTYSGGAGLSADADCWYFTVQQLQEWRFAFQSYAASGQYKLRGRVRWEETDGTFIRGDNISYDLITSNAVIDHEIELTAPIGAKRALMRFSVDRTNTTADIFVSGVIAERIGATLAKTRGELIDVVNFDLDSSSVLFETINGVTTEMYGPDGDAGLKATVLSHSSSLDGVSLSHGFMMDNNGIVSGMIATSDLIDGETNVDSSILFATDSFHIVGELYAVGTVDVTNGSKTVLGNASTWAGNVETDDWFIGPDKRRIQIDQVISGTELLLKKNYKGVTDVAEAYAVAQATPAFSVVDGKTYLKDALIEDGSLARAKIGFAAIGSSEIEALTVGTLHITDNSVTNGAADSMTVAIDPISGVAEKGLTISCVAGTTITIWINGETRNGDETALTVRHNGSPIESDFLHHVGEDWWSYNQISRVLSVTAVEGDNLIKVWLNSSAPTGNYSGSIFSLAVMEFKK